MGVFPTYEGAIPVCEIRDVLHQLSEAIKKKNNLNTIVVTSAYDCHHIVQEMASSLGKQLYLCEVKDWSRIVNDSAQGLLKKPVMVAITHSLKSMGGFYFPSLSNNNALGRLLQIGG